ncbi:MAG: hypothetical protein ACO1SV_27640 [Fimbriimonas sp.]
MAATYDGTRSTAKDRVRFHIDDRRAPFRFDNEEIVATIVGSGEAAEIRAAIELLQSETEGSAVSVSKRQGSWSRSKTVANPNVGRIASLRERLARLGATGTGPAGSPMAVVEAPKPCPECAPTPWPYRCPNE